MATKIYGASDDLIEFEGDVRGEVGCYGTDNEGAKGVLLTFSDGTMLVAKYGKADMGIWGLEVVNKGALFESHDPCADEDEEPHSDVVKLKDGVKWAYAATQWKRVR